MDIKQLIEGAVEPPNEFVAFLVKEARTLRSQHEGAEAAAARIRRELDETESTKLQIQGAHNKAMADLKHWIERSKHLPDQPLDLEGK